MVIEARPAIAKGLFKHFFKARFFDVYINDNYLACYNFCQQCKYYFATIGAKAPNCILFVAFFL